MHNLLVFLLIFFTALTGCDSAQAKFEQVHLGMARAEAVKILGEPQATEITSQGDLLRWRLSGGKTLILRIVKDKVDGKLLAGGPGKPGKEG
jgi:hypothetical protein